MKSKTLFLISIFSLASVALTGCVFDNLFKKNSDDTTQDTDGNSEQEEEIEINIPAYDWSKDKVRIKNYYSSIDGTKSGTALLTSLRELNSTKKTYSINYSSMGTSPNPYFMYTDFDPDTVQYTSNGIPYGTNILSFYSGKSATSFNKEHVWPDSRGGNRVENDILMPRPTIAAENSARGNSPFITGMTDDKNGWDPVAAFASNIGVYESIRGESARIIFYCMVANSTLVLNETVSNQGNNMSSLNNLVEWACENPVNPRERRRNVGSQFLQGNRNVFVDHPEYVCKIWGNSSSATKSACQKANYAIN